MGAKAGFLAAGRREDSGDQSWMVGEEKSENPISQTPQPVRPSASFGVIRGCIEAAESGSERRQEVSDALSQGVAAEGEQDEEIPAQREEEDEGEEGREPVVMKIPHSVSKEEREARIDSHSFQILVQILCPW